MKKYNFKKNRQNLGFTLLFAVLVSSLVLAIGSSIISISLKQIILSGSSRDSQYAFYAANTGFECAKYWLENPPTTEEDNPPKVVLEYYDNNSGIVGPDFFSSDVLISVEDGERDSIECVGQQITDDNDVCENNDIRLDNGWCRVRNDVNDYSSKFRITFSQEGDVEYCADVIVNTKINNNDQKESTIESRGYNTCDESNPRRIERTYFIKG